MSTHQHMPTYPSQVTLSATSPSSDFDTVEHHMAASLPLTVNVHCSAAFSKEWGERVRRSSGITMVDSPAQIVSDKSAVAATIARPQPASGRLRLAVLAIGIVISATTVAMIATFGLGI